MPEEKITDELTAVRDLLREGRTTEADKALNEIQEKIRQEDERRKRELPPPSPKTRNQLEEEWKQEVTDQLGNHPRLLALLTEIKGKEKEAE